MAPRHVGPPQPCYADRSCGLVWRNAMARRMWNKPARHTSAGRPTFISELGRIIGLWPFQTHRMVWRDLEPHLDAYIARMNSEQSGAG